MRAALRHRLAGPLARPFARRESWRRQLADVDGDPFAGNGEILAEDHVGRGIKRINPIDTFLNPRARIIIAAFIDRDPFQDEAASTLKEIALLILCP